MIASLLDEMTTDENNRLRGMKYLDSAASMYVVSTAACLASPLQLARLHPDFRILHQTMVLRWTGPP